MATALSRRLAFFSSFSTCSSESHSTTSPLSNASSSSALFAKPRRRRTARTTVRTTSTTSTTRTASGIGTDIQYAWTARNASSRFCIFLRGGEFFFFSRRRLWRCATHRAVRPIPRRRILLVFCLGYRIELRVL